mmetsp:Transcript_8197/g.16582  ORF Transcript_8197/g.16582 Transcript_8197/m.16582 type:complete len:275 (+) Transcript_8197:1820-2644(+)
MPKQLLINGYVTINIVEGTITVDVERDIMVQVKVNGWEIAKTKSAKGQNPSWSFSHMVYLHGYLEEETSMRFRVFESHRARSPELFAQLSIPFENLLDREKIFGFFPLYLAKSETECGFLQLEVLYVRDPGNLRSGDCPKYNISNVPEMMNSPEVGSPRRVMSPRRSLENLLLTRGDDDDDDYGDDDEGRSGRGSRLRAALRLNSPRSPRSPRTPATQLASPRASQILKKLRIPARPDDTPGSSTPATPRRHVMQKSPLAAQIEGTSSASDETR